jgi:hypothetical protein
LLLQNLLLEAKWHLERHFRCQKWREKEGNGQKQKLKVRGYGIGAG